MENWQKLQEENISTGRRQLLRRTFRMPDGRVEEFDIKLEPQVVGILALTPEQRFLIARQFRPGPERLLEELPGGAIEPGETPEEAAARELLEETGYSGDLHLVGASLDDAYSTLLRFNFVATGCKRSSDQRLEQNEFIEVAEMPLVEFRQHLRGGQLTDIETGYLGLDYLGLLSDR
jgi:ADP-ribose pyrophosphatase